MIIRHFLTTLFVVVLGMVLVPCFSRVRVEDLFIGNTNLIPSSIKKCLEIALELQENPEDLEKAMEFEKQCHVNFKTLNYFKRKILEKIEDKFHNPRAISAAEWTQLSYAIFTDKEIYNLLAKETMRELEKEYLPEGADLKEVISFLMKDKSGSYTFQILKNFVEKVTAKKGVEMGLDHKQLLEKLMSDGTKLNMIDMIATTAQFLDGKSIEDVIKLLAEFTEDESLLSSLEMLSEFVSGKKKRDEKFSRDPKQVSDGVLDVEETLVGRKPETLGKESKKMDQESSSSKDKTVEKDEGVSPLKNKTIKKDEEAPPLKKKTVKKDEEAPPLKKKTLKKDEDAPPIKDKKMKEDEDSPPLKDKTVKKDEGSSSLKEKTMSKDSKSSSMKEKTERKKKEGSPLDIMRLLGGLMDPKSGGPLLQMVLGLLGVNTNKPDIGSPFDLLQMFGGLMDPSVSNIVTQMLPGLIGGGLGKDFLSGLIKRMQEAFKDPRTLDFISQILANQLGTETAYEMISSLIAVVEFFENTKVTFGSYIWQMTAVILEIEPDEDILPILMKKLQGIWQNPLVSSFISQMMTSVLTGELKEDFLQDIVQKLVITFQNPDFKISIWQMLSPAFSDKKGAKLLQLMVNLVSDILKDPKMDGFAKELMMAVMGGESVITNMLKKYVANFKQSGVYSGLLQMMGNVLKSPKVKPKLGDGVKKLEPGTTKKSPPDSSHKPKSKTEEPAAQPKEKETKTVSEEDGKKSRLRPTFDEL